MLFVMTELSAWYSVTFFQSKLQAESSDRCANFLVTHKIDFVILFVGLQKRYVCPGWNN